MHEHESERGKRKKGKEKATKHENGKENMRGRKKHAGAHAEPEVRRQKKIKDP